VWQLRKHIGIVSHDLHARYTGETTGLEVVLSGFLSSIGVHGTLAGRVDEEDTRKATQIMQRLGIDDSASTPLKFLSTGQQRRCLLARALVHEPQTLILDEPTAGLDFSASFDYLRRISNLSRLGCNIVIATHHLNEIPPEVQRVIVLKDGRVVADGSKEQVLCAEVLSDTYEMPVRVARVDGYYLAYPGEHGPAEANRDTR
jgi:iron complex transport system ATP-binding protein